MEFSVLGSLDEVSPSAWNALLDSSYPFVRHEFLIALERHKAVGEKYGWYPQYLVARDKGNLVGAVPMYLKDNSYGELVFDWAWADAYERSGLPYYPKLVVAIPYTPATGPRILVKNKSSNRQLARQLIHVATEHARQVGVSSLHWLFTEQLDTDLLNAQPDYSLRLGCQFHWQNEHYRDFDDYLDSLTSQKRKKIKRERRMVKDQGIELEILHGDEMTEDQWQIYHRFYSSTFDRKSGYATLSKSFFMEIGATMPRNVVIVFAKYRGEYVAGAFNVRSDDTLYGRHWGCVEEFHSLHFEACYYQGLEYCIKNKLTYFEPGAQGEHKISRGFLPNRTWSAHWLANDQFRTAIEQFVHHERDGMEEYIADLAAHSPFKKS